MADTDPFQGEPPQMDGHATPAPAESPRAPRMEALVRLWHAHRRWVAAVVYAHKPRDVEVDDLLQDVAMRLVRNMHLLHDPDAVRPWLRTVAINVARSAGRRTRARSRVVTFVDGEKAQQIASDEPQERRPHDRTASERGRRALELASGLPPHYREPLLLSIRGLSQKQVADILGEPVTTIETRLIRARRMLRDELLAEEKASEPGVAVVKPGAAASAA
ncbi:MAG: sigma-70 family RNA polymerase sigma factor [Phycisphaeraceae bacterium]|nr:sigma-70 family RNA polymerase sigma factor [Phycisphaerales bacterium]QOJ17314.1 MAG: sigma-70 family RNA polymerase sigma factor [Phycisphaeraceae bacterium]